MESTQVGTDNIAVQVDGTNNSVTIIRGEARLTLLQRHKRRREPKKDLDLLDPYAQAIELVGREADLAKLEAWLVAEKPIALRCLTGRAGSGKTRLALELCARAERAGWIAGFATYDELARFKEAQHLAAWAWPQPTLVVVDYAAASARVVRAWLEQLAERTGEEKHKLRLLLLERQASAEVGWWAELTRFSGFGAAGVEDLLDPAVPVPLPSLRELDERRRVLAAVMAAACRMKRIEPPLQPPPAGQDAAFETRLGDDLLDNEPLYLLMAGLTAVQQRVPHVLASGPVELARRLAEAEVERIGRLARDRELDGAFLQHLAACVTLTDGCARDDAAGIVEEERGALRAPAQGDPDAAVMALADALPGRVPEEIDAIRPDLIGEAAVLAAFRRAGRGSGQQAAVVERAWRRAPAKVVAAVVRTAQDYAEGREEHAALAWLDRLAALASDPFELMALAAELPESSFSLRQRTADIQTRIVELLRPSAKQDESLRGLLAGALNNLGVRLSDLGRREAALAAAEEAAQLYRELAAARPDAFRPDLAMSLNNLATMLSDLGRREAALAAAEEAVAIRRELAAARPDAFRPYLASALNNLATILSDLGRREAALAAAEEAVAIRRELAAARPDAFRPDLAMSLNNLATMLSDLGRREAALAAAEEAVAIRRELAAVRPDAFRPYLAGTLSNLANVLSELGRREAALAAAEEAAQLYRELAAARPDAFRPYLATALNNLANVLSALGRREAALAAAEEAVAIRRELAAARPDAFRPDLAVSLAVLANCLEAADRQGEALAANGEAIETLREPFLQLPGAFVHWMLPMVQQYLARCEGQGVAPDGELLGAVAPVLVRMVGDQGQDGRDEAQG